jgi:1-acyl-sn-glycerol-3-phosphate acyltransferase
MYAIRSWIGGVVARVVTVAVFRSVEVVGDPGHEGPRLIVANHFGGLVDAIVAVRALGGLPHIVAKSTLFKRLPLRIALRLLGVVPVYRRADHADLAKNVSSFDEVASVLTKGRTVLIFPEGTVTDAEELQKVRTGAARMALAAIEAGAENLEIIPLGITYEDKVSARSRVLVEVGVPTTEDEVRGLPVADPVAESNHQLVREVNGLIERRLRAVAPEFGSLVRKRTMMLAADIHLRTTMTKTFAEPSMSEQRTVAQQLGYATSEAADGELAAVGRYQLALTACGLEDHQVQPKPTASSLARLVLKKSLVLLVIAPFALVGLTANLVPILLVVAVGALVKEPVTKGTARVIAGLVAFPVAWTVLILLTDPDYVWLTVLLLILGLILLIVAIAQLIDLFEALVGWWGVRTHLALLPDLYDLRAGAETELVTILWGSDRE